MQWGRATVPGTSANVSYPIAFSSSAFVITGGLNRPSSSDFLPLNFNLSTNSYFWVDIWGDRSSPFYYIAMGN